jgi:hypothetical protein
MSEELQIAAAVLAVFIVYVVAKVRSYMRESDVQWKQVNKSKLKEWQDDD